MKDVAHARTAPEISLLVPTRGRPQALEALVTALGAQTLSAERFELIVVDDGGTPAVTLDVTDLPFSAMVMRQPAGGPAAARNRGLGLCRAPLVLLLEDGAVPAPDLLESHLRAHQELGSDVAVHGTYGFHGESLGSPFVQVLERAGLLESGEGLEHGGARDWSAHWTSNVSLPVAMLVEVGGFDEENFPNGVCDGVELDVRLRKAGVRTIHREDCVAQHRGEISPAMYMERVLALGEGQATTERLHGLEGLTWSTEPGAREKSQQVVVQTLEAKLGEAREMQSKLEQLAEAYRDQELPDDVFQVMADTAQVASQFFRIAGIHRAEQGVDPIALIEQGPPEGVALAAVLVSCDALDNTRRCVETLRTKADPRHPQTIVVVDNGSTDGSAEWLEAQGDVHLIRNRINQGAPRARNQAIHWLMSGERECPGWILFLDNDVFVTEGWVRRALYHGEVDPGVGSIALCAGRASKHQVVPYDGPDDQASLDAFAAAHAERTGRQGRDTTLFTSFGVLIRSSVIERIGGFDEVFSPWGFEDDDISLRIVLAGWRNRVALDTYVHHAHYGTREKNDWHVRWMQSNWEAFVDKWSPSAKGAKLFDFAALRFPGTSNVREDQLVFPVPEPGAAAPEWEGSDISRKAFVDDAPAEAEADSAPEPAPVRAPEAAPAPTSTPRPRPTPVAEGVPPVLVLGTSPAAAARVAEALGGAEDEVQGGVRLLNEYLLGGTSAVSAGNAWVGDPDGPHAASLLDLPASFSLDTVAGAAALSDPRLLSTLPRWREVLPASRVVFVISDPAGLRGELDAAIEEGTGAAGPHLDAATALGLWRRAALRALDLEEADTCPWFFVDEARLGEAGVRAAVQAFTARPMAQVTHVAAAPAAVDPGVATAHRALMNRAEGRDVAPAATEPRATALLVGSAATIEAVQRTLGSLTRQTIGDRLEVVVAARDDEVLEALDGRFDHTRLVDARGVETRGEALNLAARAARGEVVLLTRVGMRPAPDWAERHVEALSEAGANRGTVGALEAPPVDADVCLQRVLASRTPLAGTGALATGRMHEWHRADGRNFGLFLEDLRAVGLFDETQDDPTILDFDLGARLQEQRGVRSLFLPDAVVAEAPDQGLDAWRVRCREVGTALAATVARHPRAALQRELRERMGGTAELATNLVIGTLEARSRAEASAAQLAATDLGALERAGAEGAELAIVLRDMLNEHVEQLEVLYLADADLGVMNLLGATSYAEVVGALADAPAPEPESAPAFQPTGPVAGVGASSALEQAAAALLSGD